MGATPQNEENRNGFEAPWRKPFKEDPGHATPSPIFLFIKRG